jgi:tRNA A-37 threonylcarbamoyl transferase component Bud32
MEKGTESKEEEEHVKNLIAYKYMTRHHHTLSPAAPFHGALQESRRPGIYNKYKNVNVKRNSIHHRGNANDPRTIPIDPELSCHLNRVVRYSSNMVGQGGEGHVVKTIFYPHTLLSNAFRRIKNVTYPLTKVYKTPETGTTVAIKIQSITNANKMEDLINEIKVMETLQGLPFVPKLYASIFDKKRQYLVMEYIDGKTLGDVLQSNVSVKTLETLYDNINNALIQMWKRGVVHGDFHRKNIIVLPDNSIKFIDFGMAHETNRVRHIAKTLNVNTNARVAWKQLFERYINTLMLKSAYPYYNPNSKILTILHKAIMQKTQTTTKKRKR